MPRTNFDAQRKGSGTAEWAEYNFNISNGCINNCRYCYAAEMAERFKRKERADWENEELTSNAYRAKCNNKIGVTMFPSAHDITPANIHDYIRMAKLLLSAGNRLLITSKPRPDCISQLLRDLAPWRALIMFRFTIGSMDQQVTKFWEPGAPSPQERLSALKAAYDSKFRTSVSIEPMLEGVEETIKVIRAVEGFVTGTIWIGKMNQGKRRVSADCHEVLDHLEALQSDSEILRLHRLLSDDLAIRWKDSIKKILAVKGINNAIFCDKPVGPHKSVAGGIAFNTFYEEHL